MIKFVSIDLYCGGILRSNFRELQGVYKNEVSVTLLLLNHSINFLPSCSYSEKLLKQRRP